MVLNLVGLEISVPELIWTVITFFLLMFLLKKFLYDPVLRFMDERSARIAAGLEEGHAAKQALDSGTAKLDDELAQTTAQARTIIGEARSAAEKTRSGILASAHKEAEQLHRKSRERIRSEESEAVQTVENDMPELVAALSSRLLHSEMPGETDKLICDCVRAAKGN